MPVFLYIFMNFLLHLLFKLWNDVSNIKRTLNKLYSTLTLNFRTPFLSPICNWNFVSVFLVFKLVILNFFPFLQKLSRESVWLCVSMLLLLNLNMGYTLIGAKSLYILDNDAIKTQFTLNTSSKRVKQDIKLNLYFST